jgi:3-oxosteroid 1-dehydrogenase
MNEKIESQLPDAVDVIVVGSGSAALSAALKSAVEGLSVLILEKSPWLGGTSAMSGAGTWIPANHHMLQAGLDDDAQQAAQYLQACAPDGWEHETPLLQAFANEAAPMLAFVEQHTPLRFEIIPEPDPFTELPGGKALGRMLSPTPLSRRLLGRWKNQLRGSTLPHRFSYGDNFRHDLYHDPVRSGIALAPTLIKRMARDEWGQGSALVIGLLKGCLDHGCRIFTEARVANLCPDHDLRVNAVEVDFQGSLRRVNARQAVVLASGGFEWDASRLQTHFPGPTGLLGSPRSNTGDAHRMAEAVGAHLDRMDQANIYPVLPTHYEGHLHGLPITFQATPHAIVVNAGAQRFCSEYDFNLGEALDRRDTLTGEPVNLPAWLIGDSRFLQSSPALRWYGGKDPNWLIKAGTLNELAEKTGLSADALTQTVARWNGFCAQGQDTDFARGANAWERYKSGSDQTNLALGTLERGPFLAVRFNRAILGTKGGPRTNAQGQVLRKDGSVIAGLYCAGVAMANPIGTRAVGPGTTIGPCLTWGYICAQTISRRASQG